MKISYWPLPKSKNGAGGFPNRVVINSRIKFPDAERHRVINNEIIHVLQQQEFSDYPNEWTWKGYFKWLINYIWFHFTYGYDENPFEKDSLEYDEDLTSRPQFNWEKYIKD